VFDMKIAVTSLVLATIGARVLAAESTTIPTDQLLACVDLQDAAARLACFDQVAQLAGARRAPSAPAAVPTTAPAATAALPSFGQAQLKPNERPAESAQESALHARVASSRSAGQGTYLLTLDNGQVWRHEDGDFASYLAVGEAVTISKASMGSYRLTRDAGKAKNWVRVSRIH
jgi:pyruvate/2-oxoglutarate dehydrogenase complex dihydrolipoamide acyltransferase (E2) component